MTSQELREKNGARTLTNDEIRTTSFGDDSDSWGKVAELGCIYGELYIYTICNTDVSAARRDNTTRVLVFYSGSGGVGDGFELAADYCATLAFLADWIRLVTNEANGV